MGVTLGPIAWIVRLAGPPSATVIDAESTVTMFCLVLALPLGLALVIGKRHAEIELAPTPFQFMRPLTSGTMILPKLKIAALSSLLAWLIVLAVVPLWLALWCDTSLLAKSWRVLQTSYSTPALFALLPLSLLAAVALTWRWPVAKA